LYNIDTRNNLLKENINMKRTSRVTADITLDSHNLLRDACLRFDCSKGKLIEKMIKKFCAPVDDTDLTKQAESGLTTTIKGAMQKAKRSTPKKAASYPSNLDEQFEMLWDIKGKKGAKNGTRGAYEIFKKLAANVDNDTCETFTRMLMDDILKNSGECGYPEMHLTSYLNQQRWDK
jgi:hypothetical protein